MPLARILVIEDNLDNQDLVRFLLERAGYTVMGAADGRTGLNITLDKHPDLVLLDLGIPEIDGWSLARKLKNDPATRDICVVALTAHTLPSDRRRAIDSGCDGYITKPLNVETFASDIARYLAGDFE